MKIIDAHVHLFDEIRGFGFKGGKTAIGGGWVCFDNGDKMRQIPEELGDINVTAESFLAFMERHNIEKAVCMQAPGYGYQNYYYAQLIKKYPARLLPAAMVDPEILYFDDVVENLIENQGFRVFKFEMSEIAGLTGAHCRLNTMLSKNLDRLFARVEGIAGTVALDIGGPEESSYQIGRVKELAGRYEGARLVMCHLLEPDTNDWRQLEANLTELRMDNVWFDISSLPTILHETAPYEKTLRCLKIAAETVGAGRLLWGTDCPTCLIKQDYDAMLRAMVSENPLFSKEDKENVLYSNALKAYRFEA